MDIADFARQLLFHPELEHKLHTPESLTDVQRGRGVQIPAAPARCAKLAFKPRGSSQQAAFPSLRDLQHETQRALVLHFFANHELLAMELMALALLRFPEAPAKFRRGLVAVIIEEQKHLRLYKARMEELGMGFGAVPVSRFFWDVIADTPTPLTFVTQMALTLEQANLDYSKHFLQMFEELGDESTAAILEVVYKEETSHVAHGLAWFNAWRPDDGSSDWVAYKKLLPPSLTPARAKGLGFHPEARRSAGLSEEFIQELNVYAHSKGRPPTVYWFNPGCEDEVAAACLGRGVVGPEPKAVQAIRGDLSGLLGFAATPQDVVLVETLPATDFLAQLQRVGFALPQFVSDPVELQGRLLGRFAPWGQSAAASSFGAGLGLNWQTPVADAAEGTLFSKAWAKEISVASGYEPESGLPGVVARDLAQAEAEIAARLTFGTVVVKAAYGTAGRNAQRVRPDEGLTATQRTWLAKMLQRQSAVVVEPWRQRVADFSVQINVGTGERAVAGITRFLTDSRGQYAGHVLGRKLDGLEPDFVRAYHQQDMPGQMAKVAATVGERLAAAGYTGPAGIDALVYAEDGAYKLYPLVEINPRLTMGRVAIELDRRVHAGARARWLHLPLKQLRQAGWDGADAFIAEMQRKYPLQLRHGLLESGVLATNDPKHAQAMLTVLVAGGALVADAPVFGSGKSSSTRV